MRDAKSLPTPAEIFGDRVAELRARRGWSQRELAERLRIDRTTLNKIESGVRGDVKLSQLFAFALELGTSPLYLVTPRERDDVIEVKKGDRKSGRRMKAADVREWLRGKPLPGVDPSTWFLDLPRDEQKAILFPSSDSDSVAVALAAGGPRLPRPLPELLGLGADATSDALLDAVLRVLEPTKKDDHG